MKRNWDLVRKILIKLEEQADAQGLLTSDAFVGFDTETVAYHFKMLQQAGMIEAIETGGVMAFDYAAQSLTWVGHEFLDKIRKETVWNSIKKTIKEKGLDLSVDAIKLAGAKLIEQVLT